MSTHVKTITVGCAALFITALLCSAHTARADWKPEDGHKMHFPQLPDRDGLDVDFLSPHFLADDWLCTETGPVSDIHFWVSHRGDEIPIINDLQLEIFSNIPASPDVGFSMPGESLWQASLLDDTFTFATAPGGIGDQGWFDPYTGEYIPNDHDSFFQINITDITDPFIQREGEIYWLGISIDTSSPDGWKTADLDLYPSPHTGNHYEDDAVFRLEDGTWRELRYPIGHQLEGQSIDLAFVITPEPASQLVLSLGGLLLLLFGRARRTA